MSLIYENSLTKLYQGNAFDLLNGFQDNTIDVIMVDPPYFLSKGGITCHSGKMVNVDKGEWDKTDDTITEEEFYYTFLKHAKRILKTDGTIWVFGTMHNIYLIGYLLKKLDFIILNNITWQKTNPPPNLSCRMFTHSTETVIWAKKSKKSKHYFNYQLMKEMNNGKQMKDVWTYPTTKKSEKKHGSHPTQKPIELMERIILASTEEDDLILDCFSGSSTTLLAAQNLNRRSIGIELEPQYIEISIKRLKENMIVNNINNEKRKEGK